jgi:CheY-like chemotaxis protein
MLEQAGITSVHPARSGKEALELAARVRAGILVSAMHLADMTGVQLAKALLAEVNCPDTGFVLATSESDAQELSNLPSHARIAKLMKPFDAENLRQTIEIFMPKGTT